jgi:hypothetical protein
VISTRFTNGNEEGSPDIRASSAAANTARAAPAVRSPNRAAREDRVRFKTARRSRVRVSRFGEGRPAGQPCSSSIMQDRDTMGAFIARERSVEAPDTVLGHRALHRHRRFDPHQASLGDRAWIEVVRRHHAFVREALEQWQGVENDTAGDGFYATLTDQRARSDARSTSSLASVSSGSRSEREFIPASVRSSRASTLGSR